jgi:peptide subunit release factor 1 (eRF1)
MEQLQQLHYVRDYKPKVYSGPTSMVTLIIPPGTDVAALRQTMKKEYRTATNIKSNTNRKSVKNAISGIVEYLKGVRSFPETGIALYSEQYI